MISAMHFRVATPQQSQQVITHVPFSNNYGVVTRGEEFAEQLRMIPMS